MTALIGIIWNQLLLSPCTNVIVVMDRLCFGSYGLAILSFTILLRLVTLPLTLKQMRSSKKMSQLQPLIQKIQKEYSDPKRRSEETMKLYKKEGVNPAGCVLPMVIQFPVLIALYEVIRLTLGSTPESVIDLSHRLYPWSFVQHAVPLTSHFLWMDLGQPDQTYLMPILVVVTMWLSQKLTMTQQMQANPQAAQTNQMMLIFMPLIFGWLSINYASGLGLYWVISNVVTIVVNYFVFDWHGTHPADILGIRNFSLSNINPFSILMPRPQTAGNRGRATAQRRPAPARNGRPAKNTESADLPSPEPEPARPQGARNGRPDPTTARKQPKPKARPPVRVPAQPATGRISADRAGQDTSGGEGAAEARTSDG